MIPRLTSFVFSNQKEDFFHTGHQYALAASPYEKIISLSDMNNPFPHFPSALFPLRRTGLFIHIVSAC